MTINKQTSTPSPFQGLRYREMQQLIYSLEKRLGVGAVYYYKIEADYDPTGSDDSKDLNRLEVKLIPLDTRYSFSILDSRGEVKIGDRQILISKKYFPYDHEITKYGYFVINNERFNIVDFVKLDQDVGYYFYLRRTDEEKFQHLRDFTLYQELSFTQELS